ncbi:hypothetical protein CLHUN_18630 [Ruminiclostridium hungatei]|uniref:DUF4363 family protein n=1 Tax=Ruminiclostridium hungatei TaxID=48256 RepID=A0A1V4SKA2_RUMHU|nr:DUF4363 family protein [Ruminiclostridium hungatei]OPX44308.1 hypothetical protein CLHUN_18630 [Ruminiclostridium hungatei]
MNSNTKIIILVSVLLITVVLSGSLTLYYLDKSAGVLELSIVSAGKSVTDKQWTSAEKQLEEFSRNWKNTKYFWAMLVDHFEIDNIEDSYNKTKMYVESEDYSSSLAELETLRHYIRHIPEKEGFTFENIF